jgi:hypothetical protein
MVASIFVVALAIESASTAHAQAPAYEDVGNAEGWAWSQIRQGLPADFGRHCGDQFDQKRTMMESPLRSAEPSRRPFLKTF